jgi:hypothetical protein
MEASVEVVERVADVLGGRPVLHSTVRTWDELDRVVQAGLPKRSLPSARSNRAPR